MNKSNIFGGQRAAQRSSGKSADKLGPTDTSDGGNDIQGASRRNTDAQEGKLGGAPPGNRNSDSEALGAAENIGDGDEPIESSSTHCEDEDAGRRR